MKTRLISQIVAASLFLASLSAQARLITNCFSDGQTGVFSGSSNMDTKLPIASVSKVFTSLWAAERLGLNYRFPTQVYITKNNGNYDVHLRGSAFPYFDRTMLYFLIGELNKRGIKSINNLTYDENFEYGSVVRTKADLVHSNGDQSETEIMHELRSDINGLRFKYGNFLRTTQPLVKISLPRSASLSVKSIKALSIKSFNPTTVDSTFMLRSSELHRILKELNRNSNNFSSNKIYERLARTENFKSYLTRAIDVSENEFSFVNGSGYPEMINGQKVYNTATCRTVVEVIKRLTTLANQQGKGLRYILPVAGSDANADGNSTVTNIYLNNATDESLLAKTGTITGSVSLAGAALTNEGVVYFHATATNRDYASIRSFLSSIQSSNGGEKPLDGYVAKAFVPFDENSIQEVK